MHPRQNKKVRRKANIEDKEGKRNKAESKEEGENKKRVYGKGFIFMKLKKKKKRITNIKANAAQRYEQLEKGIIVQEREWKKMGGKHEAHPLN